MRHARALKKIVIEITSEEGEDFFILRTPSGQYLGSTSSLILCPDLAMEVVDGALLFTKTKGYITYTDKDTYGVIEEVKDEAN